jgi:hypothetical protein
VIDHERYEELLAGYVLRALSGPDAEEADLLLAEHVPDCGDCRATLSTFHAVSADLALAADPLDPPDTLLPQLHRELEPRERRPRSLTALAVAASVVACVGLTGTFLQGQRVVDEQDRVSALSNIFRFARENDAEMVPVGSVTQVAATGVDEFYLYGEDVPAPPAGSVYAVWVEAGGRPTYVGWFLPRGDGWVYLRIATRGVAYDRLFITIEAAGVSPSAPGDVQWQTTG